MSRTILVVDDEAELRAMLVEILQLDGFKVYEAQNGRIALQMLEHCQVDLILCDIAMPELDGYQVLEQVRRKENFASIPFIFLSARTDYASIEYGLALGASAYLIKPFRLRELLLIIQNTLQQH